MKERFCRQVADIVDKIANRDQLTTREIAWVERALTATAVYDQLLNECLLVDNTNAFGLRFQPNKVHEK